MKEWTKLPFSFSMMRRADLKAVCVCVKTMMTHRYTHAHTHAVYNCKVSSVKDET